MKKFSSAFTMIELVFVIVVLGILAGIAVPRLAATRDDATIAEMRGDVAAIRSGLSLKRSENLMKGNTRWPDINNTDGRLFINILQQHIYSMAAGGKNGWSNAAYDATTYTANVAGHAVDFNYNKATGTFDCEHINEWCRALAQ